MTMRIGRRGSYLTSAPRLVRPRNAAAIGPMQQIDAPRAAATDAPRPPHVSDRVFRSSISAFIRPDQKLLFVRQRPVTEGHNVSKCCNRFGAEAGLLGDGEQVRLQVPTFAIDDSFVEGLLDRL